MRFPCASWRLVHWFQLIKDWRRGSESNRRIKVLQTSPLPLGYRALEYKISRLLKDYPTGQFARQVRGASSRASELSGAENGKREIAVRVCWASARTGKHRSTSARPWQTLSHSAAGYRGHRNNVSVTAAISRTNAPSQVRRRHGFR